MTFNQAFALSGITFAAAMFYFYKRLDHIVRKDRKDDNVIAYSYATLFISSVGSFAYACYALKLRILHGGQNKVHDHVKEALEPSVPEEVIVINTDPVLETSFEANQYAKLFKLASLILTTFVGIKMLNFIECHSKTINKRRFFT